MYLRDEFKNKRDEEVGQGQRGGLGRSRDSGGRLTCPRPPPLQREDVLTWPREYPKNIPQQLNGYDCGVFTLLSANYLGRDAGFDHTQRDIDTLRVKIVCELLDQRVD